MGSSIGRVLKKWFGTKEVRLLMLGLDAAGKTTILYKLALGEVVETVPTVGFNVETVTHEGLTFNVWDVGGQTKIRPLWRHYFNASMGLLYVVDSTDPDRLQESREELQKILASPELAEAPVIILANKQDMNEALDTEVICERMDLPTVMDTRQWLIQPTSAIVGDGLGEAMDWMGAALEETD